MKSECYKIFPKFYVLISYVIAFFVIAPIAYVLYLKYNFNATQTNKLVLAVLIFVIPLIFGFFNILSWLSVFEIAEKGIAKKILGRERLFLKWEEVQDVRFVLYSSTAWIIVSKTNTTAYTFREIKKKTDTMCIECSQKVIIALKKHCPMDIKDYPSDRFMLI